MPAPPSSHGARDGAEDPVIEAVVSAFRLWSSADRAAQAAKALTAERWQRQALTEDTTVAGVMVELAESGALITLRTTSGRSHNGRAVGVGADFVALRPVAPDSVVLVSLAHIGFVAETGNSATAATGGAAPGRLSAHAGRPAPAARPRTGSRRPPLSSTLGDVLALAAAEQPRVRVGFGQADPVMGDLVAVGHDMVTLRLASGTDHAYVVLASISDVSLFGSG
ncbi:MAG: hypothetical protein ACYDH5_07900 [Acidimicrobiales bacterium]